MNNNPKGAKNPKKPLIFYYAVMLLVLMMLNWLCLLYTSPSPRD